MFGKRAAGAAMLGIALVCSSTASSKTRSFEPIIDMHLHSNITVRTTPVTSCTGEQAVDYLAVDPVAGSPDAPTEYCAHPIVSVVNEKQLSAGTIAEMRRNHVVRAWLFGPPDSLERWSRAYPGHFILGSGPRNAQPEEVARVGEDIRAGRIVSIAELQPQGAGIPLDDPRLEPIWSLAEKNDVPVGLHLGMAVSLPGETAADTYSAAMTSPFKLEPVLKKHPRLRISLMHAATPLIEETMAMLFTYPSLYVDVSASDWNMPRAQFYAELKRLVDAGFTKRIMFGTDQTIFPQSIGMAVKTINDAPFLTHQQKRDILYNNAARFLRLTPAEIAADHVPPK